MSFQLLRYVSKDHKQMPGQKQIWPLRIVATALNGEDPNIFVYHVGGQLLDPTPDDVFECVATPVQLQEIPTLAPLVLGSERQIPYYRINEVNFACRSAAEAEYIWSTIQAEVAVLLHNLNSANALNGDVTVVVDDPSAITTTTTTTTLPATMLQVTHVAVTATADGGVISWASPAGLPSGASMQVQLLKADGSSSVFSVLQDPSQPAVTATGITTGQIYMVLITPVDSTYHAALGPGVYALLNLGPALEVNNLQTVLIAGQLTLVWGPPTGAPLGAQVVITIVRASDQAVIGAPVSMDLAGADNYTLPALPALLAGDYYRIDVLVTWSGEPLGPVNSLALPPY